MRLLSFLCTLAISTTWCAQAVYSQADSSEAVAGPVTAADPEMPVFELSNARLQKRRDGATQLVFDYRRTRDGKPGLIEVVARLGDDSIGRKMFAGLDQSIGSGTYRVPIGDAIRDRVQREGVEVCAIMELLSSRRNRVGLRTTDIRYHFKISNSIMLGSAKEAITTRPATPDETRRLDVWRKPRKTVIPPSDDYLLMTETKHLAPGMPVMIYLSDEWKPAEYVGEAGSSWKVVRIEAEGVQLTSTFASLLAVKRDDVARLRADPAAFTASVQLVPGLAIAVPEGFVLCPRRLPLLLGTPVKARYGRRLVDGFVIKEKFDQVDLKYKWGAYHETKVPRKHILLTPQVIEWLKAEDAAERFARYLDPQSKATPLECMGLMPANKTADPETSDTAPESIAKKANGTPSVRSEDRNHSPARKVKRYAIKLAVPKGMQIVTLETPLQPGSKLGCNWGSKWYPVTVLALHDDGAVRIRWDDFGANWDADLLREDLIIADRSVRILARKAASPHANPRKWVDRTGKFDVLARYVGIDRGRVRLRKPDGQEVEVPIDRLSEEDRRLIEDLSARETIGGGDR